MSWIEIVLAVISAVFASNGFWAWRQKRAEKNDAKTQMLVGLGHDRIVFLGMTYVERGYITRDEYENLVDYLWKPYEALGGNGSAARVIDEVKKLPIREHHEPVKGGAV